MGVFISFLSKTIGQKIVLGLTGLGLCVFLLIHMMGNLLLFQGAEAYNTYAYNLHKIKIIEIFELGLFATFLAHIFTSIFVNFKNQKAKGASYKKQASGEKRTFLGDRLLVFQGLVLVVFLVSHLLTFKYGTYYETLLDGKPARDIYRLMAEVFKNPLYVGGYILTLFVLSFHLVHGLPASIKSLGFYHPNYTPWVEKIGWLYGLVIVLGFALPVLYVFFFL